MKGEIVDQLVIGGDHVPVSAIQAIYYKITGKTDKFREEVFGAFELEKADISRLCEMLDDATKPYQVLGDSTQITVVSKDWQSQEFSSVEKFNMANLEAVPTRTLAVSVDYDCLLVLPVELPEASEIHQRYEVSVIIYQLEEDFYWALDSSSDEMKAKGNRDGSIDVEYVNYATGRSLLNVCQDWFNSLPNADPDCKVREKNKKLRNKEDFLPLAFFAVAMIGAAIFDPAYFNTSLSPNRYLLISLTLAVVSTALGAWIMGKITKLQSAFVPRVRIRLTAGDRESDKRLSGEIGKRRRRLYFWGVTVVLALLLNLIASTVTSGVFRTTEPATSAAPQSH